ncbi:MAG: hypothetical protein IJK77_00130 [Lachnospiraceae bacterium]|nr:hypothetical protein [Lachnospiraceae bacterium]
MKRKDLEKEKSRSEPVLNKLLPLAAALPGLAVILYYLLGPAAGFMSTDCIDSLRWAEATLKSGKLISDNFKYAALIPFGGNLVFLPFVALFGFSLKAQIGGLVLFVLLMAAALYYLARGMEYSRLLSAGFVSVFFLIMSISNKLREIMWEHIFYYNLGILFFCFGFGLTLRILRDEARPLNTRRETVLYSVRVAVLCIFSLIAATDGLQTLVCYTMPLLAGLIGERVFSQEKTLMTRENKRIGALAVLIILASLLGFLLIKPICGGVTSNYASGYSTYSAMDSWRDNFLKLFHNWITLFGVSVKNGDPLVSLDSVLTVIRIFMAYLLLIFPVLQLFRLNRIRRRSLRIVLLGNFAVLLFIFFAVTFGRLGTSNWRLTPLLGTSLISTFFTAADLIEEKGISLQKGVLLLAALIITAIIPARTILTTPVDYGRDQALFVTVSKLREHGLKRGYASFWWAGVMDMISGEEMEISYLELKNEKPGKTFYQQFYDVYDDRDSDSFFLMMTEKENEDMSAWLNEQREAGLITEEFTIPVKYNFYGGSGNQVYVYVFPKNIF